MLGFCSQISEKQINLCGINFLTWNRGNDHACSVVTLLQHLKIDCPLSMSSLVAQMVQHLRTMRESRVGKILWRRKWQPTPVLLPGESHGWRGVVVYSPWGLLSSLKVRIVRTSSLGVKQLMNNWTAMAWAGGVTHNTCFKNLFIIILLLGFPGGALIKYPSANPGDTRDSGSIPRWGKIPWRRKWQPTSIFLPGNFHRQRNLAGYSP